MNFEKFKKSAGQSRRVRPPPLIETEDGRCTPGPDDLWGLSDITPQSFRLRNLRTDHQLTLQYDNYNSFRSPDFLLLRAQLILRGQEIKIEPIVAADKTFSVFEINQLKELRSGAIARIHVSNRTHLRRLFQDGYIHEQWPDPATDGAIDPRTHFGVVITEKGQALLRRLRE